MSKALHIVGIAGSLRQASFSKIILQAMAEHLPAGTRFDAIDIAAYPHYNEDDEKDRLPQIVADGRAQVAASDGIVIVTPEFNHGIPGVLKNTLDWLSRPAFNSCFRHKPVMFVTHSPGPLGGVRAQYQLRETMASMLCNLVPLQELALADIAAKVSDGRLSEEGALRRIQRMTDSFLAALG